MAGEGRDQKGRKKRGADYDGSNGRGKEVGEKFSTGDKSIHDDDDNGSSVRLNVSSGETPSVPLDR